MAEAGETHSCRLPTLHFDFNMIKAIALSYPEPHNQGRFLGIWLSFRVAGQILGGVVNLGLNAKRNEKGSVGYGVYLVSVQPYPALDSFWTRADLAV